MIGNVTYEQISSIAEELTQSATIAQQYIRSQNIEELEDFLSTVESYAKFLKTTVELNKDADKALEYLKNTK